MINLLLSISLVLILTRKTLVSRYLYYFIVKNLFTADE
jgi:hypothetical protein